MAEKTRKELVKRGFTNAQIIDIEREKSLSKAQFATNQGTIYTNAATEHLYFRSVFFKFNRSSLTLEAQEKLDDIFSVLVNNPSLKLQIWGHTDAMGSADYNIALSKRRARMARNYLISKGIHAKRLSAMVYGESTPIAINNHMDGSDSPEGRRYNRRVVIAVVNQKGEVINDLERMVEVPPHLRVNKQILRQQLMYARLRP